MNAEQALAAITRYQFNLFAPAHPRTPRESWYYCCSSDRTRQGFGPTPLAAIEAAVACTPLYDSLDFLE